MKHSVLLLTLVFSGLSCLAKTNTESFCLRQFNSPEPISSTLIRSVIQDSKGYIWIGGNNGLDRYDGYQLRHIEMPEDCRGFDNVYYLCEDDEGNLWIGSFSGICVYNYATGKIDKFYDGAISCMVKSKDGAIWVAGDYGGFFRIDPVTMVRDTLKYEYNTPSEHFGSGLCYDGDEKIFFINGTGTVYRTETLGDRTLKVEVESEESPFKDLHIPMFYYSDGYIVGGAPHHTVFYNVFDRKEKETPWSTVESLVKFKGKNILATRTGVYVLDSSMNLVEAFDNQDGLLKGLVPSAMCMDRQGGLWLGTTYSGMYRMLPNLYDMKDVNLGASPSSMVEDPMGNIWVNTMQDGLKRYSVGGGEITDVEIPADTKEMLSVGIVGPDILVGFNSINAGLVAIDWAAGKTRTIWYAPATMNACLDIGDGRFIEGAQGRPGVVDTRNCTFKRFETVRTTANSILRDKEGNIWYSTNSTGLWKQKDSVWTHYITESSGVAMQIKSIYADSENIIWLGTHSNGIQRFDPKTEEVREITEFDGTRITEVRKIVEDEEGTLWAATPLGLIALDRHELTASLYTAEDGLEFDNYGIISLMKSSDGRLYASNKSGFFSFDPVRYKGSVSGRTHITITGVHVMESIQKPGHDVFPQVEDNSLRLKLRFNENSFRIHASEMDYSCPRKYDLVYRINESGKDWAPMQDGSLTITNLKSGKYTLRIGLRSSSGEVGKEELNMEIIILRPIMASAPMIILYVVFLLVGIILSMRFAKKRAVERSREEMEKSIYNSKMDFLTTLAHEIRTPLALVRAPIDAMRERVSKDPDVSLKNYFDIVSRNAEKLSNLLEELLDMNKFGLDLKKLPAPESPAIGLEEVTAAGLDLPGERPTILVVDDNADMRSFLSKYLSRYYNVLIATDGANALQMLKKTKYSMPSLILSDVMMPHMDGYELCREIRRNPEYNFLPVVLLTARGDAASRVLGTDYGADAFISKPFDTEELRRILKTVLGNRELVKAHYMSCGSEIMKSEADSKFLLMLEKYVNESLDNTSLDVTSIAEHMCISESSLFKKMKATIGIGPNEYIMKSRLNKAAALLRSGKESVGDISIKVGFNSLAYFSKCFKKEYGVTPKAYSKKV